MISKTFILKIEIILTFLVFSLGSDCVFSFGPPYEKLLLKGFASNKPINFQSTIQTRGKVGTRNVVNPLESFLANTYVKTRSGEGNVVNGKIDGYSTEFIYEIVKD